MKIDSKPLRYAHAEGHTDVCYTDDGKYIITCGNDGDVRIWADIEDDDPNSHCVGEAAYSVCYKDKRLYVATDNHAVQAYIFPDFIKDGIVARFTAPVTQIMTTINNEALGCSSENMEAKICSPEGGEPILSMSEHKGPVLSISLCPKMKFVCTASGDGVLRVWDIDTQNIVKEVNSVPKINTFFAAKVLCRMDFEPSSGKYLAYPDNREIILLEYESWVQRMTFAHADIKCTISQCRFSPKGSHLAGSTVAGQIAVWEVQSGACIGLIEHPTSHNVTAMAWNPKDNGVLTYCDVAGQLGTLLNCYGEDSSKVDEDDLDAIQEPGEENDMNDIDNIIEHYESDDDNAISLEKLKNETLCINDDDSRPASRLTVAAPATVPPQPPFQPSATPTHLEHRYMCWNDVGIVRCHIITHGESSIDVEFHDTNLHHGIHLNNYLNHTMASLSTSVVALACETPSKLVCISLLGSNKEWTVSMPDTEEILCLSASSGIVGCATNARLLRLYTPTGTQRQVISLSGPVVCVAAFNTTLMTVYHSSEPGVSDQHLSMDIVALNGRQVRSKTVPVPLTPSSKLAWLGTSDVGSPCAYDSTGILRLYDMSSGVWIPICDTNTHSRGASDTWYIVSVNEPSQMVRAILCRGTSFPLTVPKPIVTEMPLRVPLCELDTEKAQYEEQLVRWAHTTSDLDMKDARETALKLFALACRSEIEQRAIELMELLKDDRLLPLAAKYAARLGRIHLSDRLRSIAETWEKEAEKMNVAQISHFQELDTQETYDVANSESILNVSLILPQKTKEKKVDNVTPIKPVPIKSSPGGMRNPFRKQQETNKNVQSPLSLTERALVEVHSNGNDEVNTEVMKPNEGETFVDWFSRNKATLEQQNPQLTPSELTRHCVRTFKSLMTTSSTEKNGASCKRKLDCENSSDTPIANAPKQSRLSAFAFSKKETT